MQKLGFESWLRYWGGILAATVCLLTAGCSQHKDDFDAQLKEMERLCIEERYSEAIEFANGYWFSHPFSIHDVVTGKNSLYPKLSENEILFRLRLASYTKTALIGSGTLISNFFSYYRIPEIYNGMEDGHQRDYSLAGMLRQRVLENPTAVYCLGISAIEKDGVSGEALALMVPAMMACKQWNLAEKYIRVWAGLKGWEKESLKYGEVLAFLRTSEDSVSGEVPSRASDEMRALAEKITSYGKKGLTDYMNDMPSMEAECRARWAQNPTSQNILHCIILYNLIHKNLMGAANLLPAYLRLSGQTTTSSDSMYEIPRPYQEMFCIGRMYNFPINDSVRLYLDNVAWDKDIERNVNRFLDARSLWQRNKKTAEEITEEFGYTYSYNYFLCF